MLINYTVENVYSFSEQTTFSMLGERIKEFDETNCCIKGKKKILKSSSIHGLNGAGKSNLIKSLFYLKRLILTSSTVKDYISELEPFKFSTKYKNKPMKFTLNFLLKDIEYTYTLHILDKAISYEALFKKEKREVMIFERNGNNWDDINFSQKYFKNEYLKFFPDIFKKKDTLLLTLLLQIKEQPFSDLAEYIENNLIIINGVSFGGKYSDYNDTFKYIEDTDDKNISLERRNKILQFMKKYCSGLDELVYSKKERIISFDEIKQSLPEDLVKQIEEDIKNESKSLNLTTQDTSLFAQHKIYDEQNNIVGEELLDFINYTSEGTRALYRIIGGIFRVLENGGTIFIDEMMGLLHTIVISDILELFHKPLVKAQIIFTGHNPYIMNESKIRRDQIVFFTKGIIGNSKLHRLSDFKEIKSTNSFSKNYIQLLKNSLNSCEEN